MPVNRKLVSELNKLINNTLEQYEIIDENYQEIRDKIEKLHREIDNYDNYGDIDDYIEEYGGNLKRIKSLEMELELIDKERSNLRKQMEYGEMLLKYEEKQKDKETITIVIDGKKYRVIGNGCIYEREGKDEEDEVNKVEPNILILENDDMWGKYDFNDKVWFDVADKFMGYRITDEIEYKNNTFYELENDTHWGFYNKTVGIWIYKECKALDTKIIDGETFRVMNEFRKNKDSEYCLELMGENYTGIYSLYKKEWLEKDDMKALRWNSTNIKIYVKEYYSDI
jgi:hypothetical protein